jgi:dipeptidyl-peptidase-4
MAGHLYRFRPDYPDSQWQQLTQGDWVVTGLVGVDQKAGRVFFTGTKDGVLAQQVYALDLAAPSKIVRLTDPGFDNAATMDKRGDADGRAMPMRSRRSPILPTLPASGSRGSRRTAWRDRTYAPYLASHRPATFGTIPAADGTPLHWMMITPPLEPGASIPSSPSTMAARTRRWCTRAGRARWRRRSPAISISRSTTAARPIAG